MKKSRFRIYPLSTLILMFLVSVVNVATAQNSRTITGKVTDPNGEAIIGANVIVNGVKIGTITDMDGKYTIAGVQPVSVLVVSYIGYTPVSKAVGNQTVINIVLQEDQKKLDEVVVVGYGTQKKATVTGSMGAVSGEQLLKAPVAAIGNSLVGRTPGLVAVQRGGEPGKDVADIYIRGVGTFGGGASPLVVVDGVERKLNEIDPNEVESINILKDASATAVYGIRGANGVIIVTTKVGHEGKLHISYTMNYGVQNPIRLPKLLGSLDYALLNNEAATNSGMTPTFTAFDIERFQKKDDPYFHPDIDWMNYMLRSLSPQSQHNVNISGGTKTTRYFVSLGAFNQQGAFKMGDVFKQFSANPEYKRYNIRTNLDIDWTKSFSTSIKVGTSIVNSNYSGANTSSNSNSFLGTILSANPMMNPVLVDGKIIRNVQGSPSSQVSNTPLYQLLSGGYNKNFSSNLNVDVSLKYKLDALFPGLIAKVKVAYDSYYNQAVNRSKQIPMYDLYRESNDPNDWANFITPVVVQSNFEGPVGFNSEAFSKNSAVYTEGALEYSKTTRGNTIGGLLLGNTRRFYDGGNQLPFNLMGLVGRVTYNYVNKYMFEVNVGYNGSENFVKDKQFGLFPAISGGYAISQESFFPKNDVLTFMKFRASYGLVGNDKLSGSRFLFLPSSFANVSNAYNDYRYYFGQSHLLVQGYKESSLGNTDVTWEKAKKTNFGLDLKFFKEKLTFNTDYFFETRNDILWRLNIPASFGNASLVAPYNIGQAKNHGYEFELGFKDKAKNFSYWVNANYSFARNKIVYMDESPAAYPGLAATNNRIGQPKGLVADGLFNTQAEIDDPTRPKTIWEGTGPKLGDIKYVDVNGDGKIDDNDKTNIGHPNIPEIVYGLSFGFDWKGFELSALIQGTGNVSTYISGDGVTAFQGSQKAAYDFNLERWTPERFAAGEKITYPRVTLGNYLQNYQYSSYWQQDASYVRLKNIEVAYKFNLRFLKDSGINNLRVFANGQNLYTLTKMRFYDPEIAANTSGGIYPMMRVFNFGFNVQF
jgi:TonB-linked SusC/RagA family outer membrane protein